MKVLIKDLKKGFVKVAVDSPEDLWYLSQLVEPGDGVSGRTERKINLGGEGEKAKIVKKTINVEILVEKVDYGGGLRFLGIIVKGPDDVPKGSHQSISVDKGDVITVSKERWLSFQLEKLEEAQRPKTNILIVVFDREEAVYGLLTNKGVSVLAKKKGDVSKKGVENVGSNFYREIAKDLDEYEKRYAPDQIIVASPSFWKDYLMKELKDKKNIVQAGCSDVSENALKEIIKRPELKKALEKSRASVEEQRMSELLENVSKDNAFYGIKEAKEKIGIGNVQVLFVSENFIKKMKEDGNYPELEALMKAAEKVDAGIVIIQDSKQLDGLGGIAGILRWRD